MLQTLRQKMRSSRKVKIPVITMALLILLTGAGLLYHALRPIHVPDLKTASLGQVTDFLCGDYGQLSPPHQRAFMRELASWYLSTDNQQRKNFEASWQNMKMPKDIKSRIKAQVRIASIHQLSSQYANVDADARNQYLAQVSFMINALPSGRKLKKLLDDKQWDQVIDDPFKYRHKMDNYAQEMALHSTAEQRAQFIKLCHDLAVYNGLQKK